ncbi:MAG TPA: hypothetical protein VHC22_12830 [Pirellulales bacterium]|nr:hypothetical protein [Pirellulales bacterium]
MQPSDPLLSDIRRKVREALGAMAAGVSSFSEMVLIEDGYVVGRRFCNGTL